MAPTKYRKNKAVAFLSDSESDEGTPSPQQAEKGENMFAQAEKLVSNNQKRRDAQRKVIKAEHEQKVKTTNAKINKLFTHKKTRVDISQRAIWERLNDMNKRRQEMESRILASMKRIELRTENISSEIEAILSARIKDIEHASAEEAK